MQWIRDTYGVPAKRGGRVAYAGHGPIRFGTICGAHGHLLRIRLDGDQQSTLFHPEWQLRYLAGGAHSDVAQAQQGEG